MLRWKRRDLGAWSVLVTAALTPALWADEWVPAAAYVEDEYEIEQTSGTDAPTLERLRQRSANERWDEIKSQSATSRVAVPQPRVERRPVTTDEAWAEEDAATAAPFPDLDAEPSWVTPASPMIRRSTSPAVKVGRSVMPTSDVVRRAAVEDEELSIEQTAQQDPIPSVAPTRRKLRSIGEISPFYDRDVDKDIRDYAEARAADYDVKFGSDTFTPRAFADTAVIWDAPNMSYFPLYFEDPALERYGHAHHPLVQPFASAGRFTGQLLALPYQMTIDPIWKPTYGLGWYRPGEIAPKLHYQVPWNAQAAAVEAGVVTGLIFLIP